MAMQQFDDGKYKTFIINWSEPKTLEEVKVMDDDSSYNAYFYKIVGVFNNKFKLFYIGKCFKQYVTKRLFQPDHIRKQAEFKEKYKKHRLLISLGNIEYKKHKPVEIDNVERLLIYSHSHDDFSFIKNKQCSISHKVIKNYRIENKGWLGEGMYRKVAYGLFFEK